MGELSLKQLYARYKALDLTKLTPELWNQELQKRGLQANETLGEQWHTVSVLTAKVARQCDFEEFESFMENGELPTIKLSQHEMSVLRGGGNSFFQDFAKNWKSSLKNYDLGTLGTLGGTSFVGSKLVGKSSKVGMLVGGASVALALVGGAMGTAIRTYDERKLESELLAKGLKGSK